MTLVFGLLLAMGGQAAVDPERPADPVVCKRSTETGSRLKAKKVCMTRSQWDARRREERMAVEQAQASRRTAETD